MKYVLSTGETTTNKITYISDLIRLYLVLNKNEIPYSNIGSDRLVRSLSESDVLSSAGSIMNSIITNITSNTTESNTDIKLTKISLNGFNVNITLTIDDQTQTYEI